jgi:hypothetical protein
VNYLGGILPDVVIADVPTIDAPIVSGIVSG